MANKGLKNYTKQLTFQVGKATANINLFKEDSNLHITVPLLFTRGLNQFGANLIYNYQEREKNNSLFGYGFKLDYFAKVSEFENTISVENADGSIDEYILDEWNEETQMKVSKVADEDYIDAYHIEFEDRNGNKKIYGSHSMYPKQINMKNGDSLTLDFISANDKTINNGKGDILHFYKGSNGKVALVTYTYNGTILEKVQLGYTNNKLVSITYLTANDVQTGKIQIKYETEKITLIDCMSDHRNEFNFTDDYVEYVRDGYEEPLRWFHTTEVNYFNNYTSVRRFIDDTWTTYYFDNKGIPLYQVDSRGYVLETEYDENKRLIAQSKPFLLNSTQTNYFDGLTMEDFNLTNVTSERVALTDSKWSTLIGDHVYKFSHSGTDSGYITFEVPIGAIGTDNVTALLWARQEFNKDDAKDVIFNMQIGDGDHDYLKKENADDNFELIMLGANCKASQENVRFLITLRGDVSFELGGIQIIRQDFGSFFEYTESGNISLLSRSGEIATRAYNTENQLNLATEFDTTINTFEYNSMGYPTKATSTHGIEISNEYDENHPSLLTKQTLTDKEDNKTIEVKKEYSADGRHTTKEYNELDECVSTITYENDKPKTIIDAKGAKTTFSYENDLVMSMLLEKNTVELSKATYTYYDDTRRLKTVTLKNGSVYEFLYDFRGNVSAIKLNGVIIFSYYYDEVTGNLRRLYYGPTNEHYEFYYKQENLLEYVKFVTSNNEVQQKFHYEYDERRRLLERVTDKNNATIALYEYDAEGKITKTTQNAYSSIEYFYDNLGNVNSLLRKVQSKHLHESYSNASRSQGEHPEIMKERFGSNEFFGLFDGTANLKLGNTELVPLESEVDFGKDGLLPYVNLDTTKLLKYIMPYMEIGIHNSGCVMFWFRPSDVDSTQYLFSLKGGADNYITAYLEGGYVRVDIKEIGKSVRTLISSGSSRVLKDKWNFFALNFYNRKDEGAIPESEVSITINGETSFYTNNRDTLDIDISASSLYYIGRRHDGSVINAFNGQLTCLAIAPGFNNSIDSINSYYVASKDYVEDSRYLDDYEKTVDVSETVAIALSATTSNDFEVFPLNNHLISLKGVRPVEYTKRTGVVSDKDKAFNFNRISRRYAYVADGSKLVYSFGQSNSGTILMRAYTEASAPFQYLLEGKDENGITISLRRDENNKLILDCDQYEYMTTLQFSNNVWHTVGMSFKKVISGDSENELVSGLVRIYLDGQVREFEVPIGYTNLKFSIGRRYDAEVIQRCTGKQTKCYPFNGQLEMLVANNAYNTLDSINKAVEVMNSAVTKTNEFDDFGRLKQSCLLVGDNKILERYVGYSNRPGNSSYTSERVSSDSFEVYHNGSNNGFDRIYTYDSLGNVTAINDGTIGSHTYAYDNRGFLIRDDNTTFAYDGNGNITQKGSSVFVYDSVIKDRLVEVGGEPIEYSEINPLIPTSFDGCYYSYEGKRLVAYTTPNGDYTYEYNDQGQRIKKSYSEEAGSTIYVYDGNKLVSEVAGGYQLDFLYDENGQLYGFIKNGIHKYFYLRDSLQNIIAIIDSTGNLVVRYNYTAYGLCTITYNSEGIAEINPFRYKGYYYDQESGMYYCNSRYYVPEWCRWLTPDSPSFLQPESLNGMNLFAYCGNDPVNKVDSSGNFAISTFLIGAGIGALVGFATSVLSQKFTGDRDINWGLVALDTVVGGLSGAIGASGVTKAVSVVAGGLIGVAGSVAGDLITSNGDLEAVNIGKAITMGVSGAMLGLWTGAGAQNTKAMVKAVNSGKSWGSKAFLTSAKEVAMRPNSGLTIQTMYMNMEKAIRKYLIQGISKVSATIFGSTLMGNIIDW